jgi:hypothetical protein
MIRWHCLLPAYGGGTMPDFTTVSVKEAQLRTIAGRQGRYMNVYANYIQQLPKGQAGRLRIGEEEKPLTIRRRLAVAAQTLGINLIIKRSGSDVYFWKEGDEEEQPKSKRRYTRRKRLQEETAASDQPFSASEEVDYGASLEESPE